MTPTLISLAAVTLLVLAIIADARWRRIPNVVSAGLIILWIAYATLTAGEPAWVSALLVGAGAFAAGFALWRLGVLGGGDVKLMTALVLWAGTPLVLPFLLATAVLGGVLAMMVLALRWIGPGPLGLAFEALLHGGRPPARLERPSVPYGIALGLAGLWLVQQRFWS